MKNNGSADYKGWTTAELKREAAGLEYLIYEIECYSVNDMIRLQLVYRELERREAEAA